MDRSEFSRLFECHWEPTEKDVKLHELACRYHDDTDLYDNIVCTGGIGPGGGKLPATPRECGFISRNAMNTLRELQHEAERYGITKEELSAAIRRQRT